MKRHAKLFLTILFFVTVLGAFFVYPQGWGGKFRPWKLGLDLVGGSHLVYEVDLSQVKSDDRGSVLNGLRDVIERRVNLFGVSEPQIYVAISGDKAELVVELAGVKDVSQAIDQIGATPLLDFREVVRNGTSTPNFIPTELTGRYVTGAQLSFDPNTQKPEVDISFNDQGAKLFEDITGRNVGKPVAIFLDNAEIEEPTVRQQISGGKAVISGGFTIQTARSLVERFNAGALPAPIKLITQQTVSATLGTDSLRAMIVAGIVGTLVVAAFMIAYYGFNGIFAVIALLIYIILNLAVFKLVPVTMTLSGLAGFIITIGMAVDANILTFERMKEEYKRGLTGETAREEGFRRAWPSIRDSNISTIITAVILYFVTSSFVRGFALTLMIGVFLSMFSAITTTRALLRAFGWHLNSASPKSDNSKDSK